MPNDPTISDSSASDSDVRKSYAEVLASLAPDVPVEAVVVPISVRVSGDPTVTDPTSQAVAIAVPPPGSPGAVQLSETCTLWFYRLDYVGDFPTLEGWKAAVMSPLTPEQSASIIQSPNPIPWLGGSAAVALQFTNPQLMGQMSLVVFATDGTPPAESDAVGVAIISIVPSYLPYTATFMEPDEAIVVPISSPSPNPPVIPTTTHFMVPNEAVAVPVTSPSPDGPDVEPDTPIIPLPREAVVVPISVRVSGETTVTDPTALAMAITPPPPNTFTRNINVTEYSIEYYALNYIGTWPAPEDALYAALAPIDTASIGQYPAAIPVRDSSSAAILNFTNPQALGQISLIVVASTGDPASGEGTLGAVSIPIVPSVIPSE